MRSFDGKDMCMGPKEDPRPFCKFCFAKAFGISALDITELVQIAPSNQIATQGLWAKMIQEQWTENWWRFLYWKKKSFENLTVWIKHDIYMWEVTTYVG